MDPQKTKQKAEDLLKSFQEQIKAIETLMAQIQQATEKLDKPNEDV